MRLKFRAIKNAGLCGLTALAFAAVSTSMARAASDDHDGMPQEFSTAACYELEQKAGRLIAWARWEERIPEEQASSVRFHEDTPVWIIDLINRWIEDANQWEVTDNQVWEWANELGEGATVSRADELTAPQTISIWLRRIARQCHQQHA